MSLQPRPGEILEIKTSSRETQFFLCLSIRAQEQEWLGVRCEESTRGTALKISIEDLSEGTLTFPCYLRPDRQEAFNLQSNFVKVAQLTPAKLDAVMKSWARSLAESFYSAVHRNEQEKPFRPTESRIPYAGRVFDGDDIAALMNSALDFWLTSGRQVEAFEKSFAAFMGLPYALLVNSGSSANLLAFSALTSPSLGDRRIRKGDEVITVAAGFPTTVTPIIQFGAVPVFVDIQLPTYNIDVSQLEEALSSRTKAVMVAHTLGNPFDLDAIKAFCEKNNLWLIEDNCDALGSLYFSQGEWKLTGTFGDLATSSFYPPHHMTMGEGGAVYTRNAKLKRAAESFRDWGRDCWCPAGHDNTCRKRFDWRLGELPAGYDHKYIYSHLGYNLKATDMQGAIGLTQLKKVPSFVESRRRNWETLRATLAPLEEFFILPEATPNSKPSWFGFLLTLRENAPFDRKAIVEHLEKHQIQTRMLFGGNLLRHPAFNELRAEPGRHRVVSNLVNTDRVMQDGFWFGVYPGLNAEKLAFISQSIHEFVRSR